MSLRTGNWAEMCLRELLCIHQPAHALSIAKSLLDENYRSPWSFSRNQSCSLLFFLSYLFSDRWEELSGLDWKEDYWWTLRLTGQLWVKRRVLLVDFEKEHDQGKGPGGSVYTRTGLESVPMNQVGQGHLWSGLIQNTRSSALFLPQDFHCSFGLESQCLGKIL